jgi:hypothetical protein
MGECPPTFCGENTFTGPDYADWKGFDTSTSIGGVVTASAVITDLEGAPGIWVRENLQDGYVPFAYPPDGPPGSNVSAELYCHTDIQNYDNYDEVISPVVGGTYYCVAFNAIEEEDEGGGNPNDGFTLTVIVSGDGKGVVSGTGIDCDNLGNESPAGEDCTETYPAGTVVDLTSEPHDGSAAFQAWLQTSGTCTATTSPCQVTMNGDVTVEATFDFDGGQGGSNGGGGGSSRRSSNSNSNGQVLGDSTSAAAEALEGQGGAGPEVLGATTLPRTGFDLWLFVSVALAALILSSLLRGKMA